MQVNHFIAPASSMFQPFTQSFNQSVEIIYSSEYIEDNYTMINTTTTITTYEYTTIYTELVNNLDEPGNTSLIVSILECNDCLMKNLEHVLFLMLQEFTN
jgi:hypothetical protein